MLNQLSPVQALQLQSLEDSQFWPAIKEWAEELERKFAVSVISGLQPNESSESLAFKVSQARGMIMALKLLLKLPEDARAIVEQEARKAAREGSGDLG